jgi:hypothetical protein
LCAYVSPLVQDLENQQDVDDVGALCMAHALADNGEAELVAVVQDTSPIHLAGAISVLNHYYGLLQPWQNIRKRAPLISNSSDEDIRYFAIMRCRLTSNDALPPLKTCGIAQVFPCINESSVAYHQPKLRGQTLLQFDEFEMSRIRNEQNWK